MIGAAASAICSAVCAAMLNLRWPFSDGTLRDLRTDAAYVAFFAHRFDRYKSTSTIIMFNKFQPMPLMNAAV